jgi:hypothetical protein
MLYRHTATLLLYLHVKTKKLILLNGDGVDAMKLFFFTVTLALDE